MNIPYTEFEQYINETILSRGLSYFKKGFVTEVEEISPNKFEAVVLGSDEYTVNIQLEDNSLTDYYCSCPYDHGPVCKHIAAVLFHMQQDNLGIQVSKPRKSRNNNTSKKRKTIADKVIDTLNEVSHEELKQFVIDRTNRDKSFRESFLANFAYKTEKESTAFYKKLAKAIINSHSYKGFVHYSSSHKVAMELRDLLNQAEDNIEQLNQESVIYIATGVLEETVKALQFSDDSGGNMGGVIEEACDILHRISDSLPSDEISEMLFNYCIKAYEKGLFAGWDWHLDMLTIASNCFQSDKEFEILMKHVDKKHKYEFINESLQLLKYQILSDAKGEAIANEYLFNHLTNHNLRKIALQITFDDEDYGKAKEIAQEGIINDKDDKPGLVSDWTHWLLRIAQATDDKEEIIRIARNLMLSNKGRQPIEHYYTILKDAVNEDE